MANISTYLNTIQNSTKASEIRTAIYNALNVVNENIPVSNTIASEVADARIDANSVSRINLRQRLNADYNTLVTYIDWKAQYGIDAKTEIDNAKHGYSTLKYKIDDITAELALYQPNTILDRLQEVANARIDASSYEWTELKRRLDHDYSSLREYAYQVAKDGRDAKVAIDNAIEGYSSLKDRIGDYVTVIRDYGGDALIAATRVAQSAAATATNAVNTAASSASSASTYASQAATSASRASNYADQASASASQAATSASNASTYASRASTSASNASTSASTAQTYANNASTANTNAQDAANRAYAAAESFNVIAENIKSGVTLIGNDLDNGLYGQVLSKTRYGDPDLCNNYYFRQVYHTPYNNIFTDNTSNYVLYQGTNSFIRATYPSPYLNPVYILLECHVTSGTVTDTSYISDFLNSISIQFICQSQYERLLYEIVGSELTYIPNAKVVVNDHFNTNEYLIVEDYMTTSSITVDTSTVDVNVNNLDVDDDGDAAYINIDPDNPDSDPRTVYFTSAGQDWFVICADVTDKVSKIIGTVDTSTGVVDSSTSGKWGRPILIPMDALKPKEVMYVQIFKEQTSLGLQITSHTYYIQPYDYYNWIDNSGSNDITSDAKACADYLSLKYRNNGTEDRLLVRNKYKNLNLYNNYYVTYLRDTATITNDAIDKSSPLQIGYPNIGSNHAYYVVFKCALEDSSVTFTSKQLEQFIHSLTILFCDYDDNILRSYKMSENTYNPYYDFVSYEGLGNPIISLINYQTIYAYSSEAIESTKSFILSAFIEIGSIATYYIDRIGVIDGYNYENTNIGETPTTTDIINYNTYHGNSVFPFPIPYFDKYCGAKIKLCKTATSFPSNVSITSIILVPRDPYDYVQANTYVYTKLQSTFDSIYSRLDELEYLPITMSVSATPSAIERGTATVNIRFVLTFNQRPVVIYINNNGTLEQTIRDLESGTTSYIYTRSNVTVANSNQTGGTGINYSIVAHGTTSDSHSENYTDYQIRILIRDKIHWGKAAIPTTINSAFILGLSNSALVSSKSKTFTLTAGANEYVWFASPTHLGTCTFTVGGFTGGFSLVSTISHTNASGGTTNYYVYRSDNANLGSVTVVVS